jgi:hypothetical protein
MYGDKRAGCLGNTTILSRLGSNGESHRIAQLRRESQGPFCIMATAIYVVQNSFGSSYQNGILVRSIYQIGLIVATSQCITKSEQEPVSGGKSSTLFGAYLP